MIKSFFGFTFENLETFLIKNNLNKNNAISLFNFFFKNYNFIDEINHIENVSKKTIEIINKKLKFVLLKIIKKSTDNNGKTIKFLLELFDKECIETVLMKFDYGYSICVSTQVGCNMGCKFCASGLIKKIRNLTTEEIVLQIITIQQEFLKDEKIKNVVFMGIGEPFDNYKNVVNAIKIITNHFGLGIAERKITVSTSGIVPKIIKFAKEQPKISLAISLHASTDKIRNKIMPINYL
jgi:23S rRNA (adenine2503-C2)-methyltransferase